MDPNDSDIVPGTTTPIYTVTLTLSVDDMNALWEAAAERALRAPGMTLANVLDTLGPREDPSISDCIAMLTAPAPVAGCTASDFVVEEIRSAAAAAGDGPVEGGLPSVARAILLRSIPAASSRRLPSWPEADAMSLG